MSILSHTICAVTRENSQRLQTVTRCHLLTSRYFFVYVCVLSPPLWFSFFFLVCFPLLGNQTQTQCASPCSFFFSVFVCFVFFWPCQPCEICGISCVDSHCVWFGGQFKAARSDSNGHHDGTQQELL
jgi:hypothetical protein